MSRKKRKQREHKQKVKAEKRDKIIIKAHMGPLQPWPSTLLNKLVLEDSVELHKVIRGTIPIRTRRVP